MIYRLISIAYLIFIGVSSMALFPVALLIWGLTVAVDRRLVVLHLFSCFWASLYLWVMPAWSITIRGRDRIRWDCAQVVVSNHQSQLDILVAFRMFFPFKWVSKAEVFRLPFIGWNMVLNRYIRLKRGDKASIRKMFADCEAALAAGSSVFLFPEGTRSETETLRPFKPGAFILAKKMKVPIVPIVIDGTRKALPKYSLNIRGHHHITVSVLEPIAYEAFAHLEANELAETIRCRIAAHLK
jgi:1-acyl-sn-glycerol-3-phosphate acyltransferase